MKNEPFKIDVSSLSRKLGNIESSSKYLATLKEEYHKAFLEETKSLYVLLRKNSRESDGWLNQTSYGIGTTYDRIPNDIKEKIVLKRDPYYITYLCHTMVGCLVLNEKLTCSLGVTREYTVEIFPIIKETATMIGLDVSFSTEEKEGKNGLYTENFATFTVKKVEVKK